MTSCIIGPFLCCQLPHIVLDNLFAETDKIFIDATDRSKISSDQKPFFIALSLYPLSFFANTPFKERSEVNSGLYFRKTSLKTQKKFQKKFINFRTLKILLSYFEI